MKNVLVKRSLLVAGAVLLAAALLALGYRVGRSAPSTQMHNASSGTTHGGDRPAGDRKVLYWYDTMAPQQHFDKPGLSPMGMQMVPRYADEETATDSVRIDPATLQNLGMRTAVVERRALGATIRVPATITWDLRQVTAISARADGIVIKLDVRAPYTTVAAGAPLLQLLAPQWNSALAEYDALGHAQSTDAKVLRDAARQRLHVLGLSEAEIRTAARGHGAAISVRAPHAGVVAALDVREGQHVSAGQALMTLNGLSTVWVEAAVPQASAATLRRGTPATINVDAWPGRAFHGAVETVLPDIDAATRTQRVRIVLDNADAALSPGMFASVQLDPETGAVVPVVPDEAVIAAGSASRVIVIEEDGRFRAAPVRTGRAAGGYTEILDGLDGGEKIVVSGQFLIDSEASLSGALERLRDDRPKQPPVPASPNGDAQ